MDAREAARLHGKATALGFKGVVRQLKFGAGLRLYLYKPGYWTFIESEEDLQNVAIDNELWVAERFSLSPSPHSLRNLPLSFHSGPPVGRYYSM